MAQRSRAAKAARRQKAAADLSELLLGRFEEPEIVIPERFGELVREHLSREHLSPMEIERDVAFAASEYEVAFAHIAGLAASAPDPDFSRKALDRLLCANYVLASSLGNLLAALLEMHKKLRRDNGAANGRKSGEKRRSACAWGYVDGRVQQIWAANNTLSRQRIANLIAKNWPANVERPSDRALYERVRKLNLT
jgi:hypothetical protein